MTKKNNPHYIGKMTAHARDDHLYTVTLADGHVVVRSPPLSLFASLSSLALSLFRISSVSCFWIFLYSLCLSSVSPPCLLCVSRVSFVPPPVPPPVVSGSLCVLDAVDGSGCDFFLSFRSLSLFLLLSVSFIFPRLL